MDSPPKQIPPLKVGQGWISLEVLSEANVSMTFRGYAPVLQVKALKSGLEYLLYISAKSLGEQLEPRRSNNAGRFTGLKFDIRKASAEQMSPYELRDA